MDHESCILFRLFIRKLGVSLNEFAGINNVVALSSHKIHGLCEAVLNKIITSRLVIDFCMCAFNIDLGKAMEDYAPCK